ncbi:MAG: sugar phosphate isomerase/epimerase [Candidatus Omnitrophica bacterium]|nr:sugar phosphate isomerase/epimerase [Candidatus Omnitrophota bacterium]
MLAISTAWNSWKYYRAKEIIQEVKALGFEQVELNFSLSANLVEEMFALKDQGAIQVVSVHNFCPIPVGVLRQYASPDLPSLSSINERERRAAVKYTQQTIDTASRLRAQAVILHTGRVKMRERIRDLRRFQKNGETKRFAKLKEGVLKQRRTKAKKFFNQALKSLEQLCKYSLNKGVKLGIENRYYISEIPSIDEMQIILEKFTAPALYYWHDVGHAQVYENLEIAMHKQFLDRFGERLLGMHLHDIKGIDDHRAPLQGTFDFKILKPYLRKDTIKVLEPHHPATKEEIIKGADYLKKLFGES